METVRKISSKFSDLKSLVGNNNIYFEGIVNYHQLHYCLINFKLSSKSINGYTVKNISITKLIKKLKNLLMKESSFK